MFTVKFRGSDNFETAYECLTYRVEPIEGRHRCFRFMTFDNNMPDTPQSMLWAMDMCDGPGIPDTIYVMNSHGATIAKYEFRPVTWDEDSA